MEINLPRIDPVIVRRKVGPFDDENYRFDLKYDGYRAILYKDPRAKRVRLMSKQGRRHEFFQLEFELASMLPAKPAILDGEVCSFDEEGRPMFEDLRIAARFRQGTVGFVAFDILWLGRKDLRQLPLRERRKILEEFVGEIRTKFFSHERTNVQAAAAHATKNKYLLQVCHGAEGAGTRYFEIVCEQGQEGVVAKSLAGTYGRSTRWVKILNPKYAKKPASWFAKGPKKAVAGDNGR